MLSYTSSSDAPPAAVAPAHTPPSRYRAWLPLVVALLLLCLYQAGVSLGVVPKATGVGEMSINRIVMERLLYRGDAAVDLVLTGSSCTRPLHAEFLGGDAVNLGMTRQSGATGVEMIRRLSLRPRILVVEVDDTLWFRENHELLDYMLEPRRRWLRARIPILRDEYRPVNVVVGAMSDRYMSRRKERETGDVRVNPAYTQLMIRRSAALSARPLTTKQEATLIREAESLRPKIDALRAASVRVVLHHVPRDRSVDTGVQQRQVRALLQRIFPQDRYEWVPAPPSRQWETTDGIHLTGRASIEYARYLNDYLGRPSPVL